MNDMDRKGTRWEFAGLVKDPPEIRENALLKKDHERDTRDMEWAGGWGRAEKITPVIVNLNVCVIIHLDSVNSPGLVPIGVLDPLKFPYSFSN